MRYWSTRVKYMCGSRRDLNDTRLTTCKNVRFSRDMTLEGFALDRGCLQNVMLDPSEVESDFLACGDCPSEVPCERTIPESPCLKNSELFSPLSQLYQPEYSLLLPRVAKS